MRSQTGVALGLLVVAGLGCATYKQTSRASKDIYDIRVTTNPDDVKECRRIKSVDATDPSKGCGLVAQPTTLECLRYQVALAGGDTLLANGFIGVAYQCAAPSPTPPEVSPTPTRTGAVSPSATPSPTPRPSPTPSPSAAPAVAPAPLPSPTPTPTPVPSPAKPSPTPAGHGVRLVQSREAVKGCVYIDEIDLKTQCPVEGGGTPISCIAERAALAGGNTVLVEAGRALIFSCKASSP